MKNEELQATRRGFIGAGAAAVAAQTNRLPSDLPWAEIRARREQLRIQTAAQSGSKS